MIDLPGSRYAVAVYQGKAFLGFVPGTVGRSDPVAETMFARKFSLPADARIYALDNAALWAAHGYGLRAWDLEQYVPLED